MSKLASRNLAEESFPADVRTWIATALIQPLNKLQSDLRAMLNGGLTVADNLAQELTTVSAPKGVSTVSLGTRFAPPKTVTLEGLVESTGLALTAAPFIAAWHFAGPTKAGDLGKVTVTLGGLTASKAYKATFRVSGG